jgi:hypothetical protein
MAAPTGNFIEMASGRVLMRPQWERWTGTKVYYEDDGGAALPDYGDEWSSVDGYRLTQVTAWNYKETFINGDARKRFVTVMYREASSAPEPTGEDVLPFDDTTSFELMPKKLSVSSTSTKLDDGSTSVWVTGGDVVKQPRYKRIPTATWSIPKVYSSWDTLLATIEGSIGKVGSADFGGLPGDVWMFTGCEGGEYLNAGGTVQIRADFTFEMKTVPDGSGGTLGWNALYDEANSRWDNTTPLVYESTDFNGFWV